MTLSKRTAVEIFGIENLMLEWDGLSSTPFIKYEVGKVRIIYPLDMTSSIMISFVANTLHRALYHNGWSELGKDPGEIYARRKYVEHMEYLYASSDDGVDFNGSHSAADMEDIVRNLVAELRPHLKNEVYQDLVTMAESYCEKIKTKQIKLPSGNQTTPNTLLSGDPLTQFFNTVINMLATAASFSVPWKSKQVSLKGDDSCVLHTTEEEGESYVKEKQEVGVTINLSKTHIEFGMVELEKCIVTKTGFKGCLLRKIGSVAFAERELQVPNTFKQGFVG